MTQVRTVVSALVVTLGLLVAACDSPDVTEPTNELAVAAPISTSASLVSSNAQPRGMDALFVSLNREVPGFGGMFIDPDEGALYVYLKDLGRSQGISTALERRFGPSLLRQRVGREGIVKELTLKFLPAEFDAEELAGWRAAVSALGFDYGLTYLDLAEQDNRVHVGVDTQANASALSEHLSGLGIPDGAVLVEVIAPGVSLAGRSATASSSAVIPTVRGGIDGNNPAAGGLGCTVGFPAVRFGVVKGFVTASHCSSTLFGVDAPGMDMFENSAGDIIGFEQYDPESIEPGTPRRRSDASFVRLAGGVPWKLAELFIGSGEPITPIWSRSDSLIGTHASEFSHPIMIGKTLEKYGKTSGRGVGVVTATCVEQMSAFPVFFLDCVNTVAGVAAGGDSGGPVFQRSSWPNQPGVSIAGVLSIGLPGDNYAYSPMVNIMEEVGWMTVLCGDPSDPICSSGEGGAGAPPGGEEDPPEGGCPPPLLICKE